ISSFVDSNILDGIIIFDHHGKLLRANQNAISLFESKAEISLKDELLKKLDLEDKETVVWKEFKQGHYEIHYKPIFDDKGIFVASVFTFHDITENVARIEKEHKMATFDQLSNSFNRSGFLEACRKVLEDTENETTYALLISGIVNFKGINSLYGSNFGDKVLIGMAESLHSLHHKFEMIYGRTAEGKFTSLIPFEYVDTVVEELSKLTVEGEDHAKIHIDICNGFVVMNDKKRPIGYYYERALLALDKCKKKVDTPVLEYTKEMAEEQRRYQLMREEMRAAIDKKEFFIVLQPQIDMKENKVCGAEALVRWNHPILGLVFPGDFIPLFEDNGYITKLDRYVWEEAASTIREFMDRGVYDGHISINVSRVDIMSFDVCDFLINLVEKYKIPVEKLHVEVTESALVNGKDSLVSTLEKLREYGFIVEIDDFGSGYSSLNSLMHIPFDVVKLDMVFMRELTKAEKDEIIIGSIAKLIHDLHASIVVEGVENQDNVDMIHRFKGDVSQGYFYSKPIPKEIFLEYVSNFK
ncbi:MAG: EAL domain-containing protein, partial [Lachnospiraceae bacterium]|nr:EAL domain-containing protein [Lachnospiraceae bacterium]